ncbi:hypothetical protein CCR95_14030 [Thiocystis minor]|uniref:hypothetical protein n=1 Tax=Thiocystis minor TaxID=61597 RepID=UPI001913783E|nr:hypothetical protein [Thiocystis minor]MBK5965176.1 hypothetical protein [Thiocystis minor]
MDSESPAQGAFLDIATNLLAIILIVTLFSLVAARRDTQTSSHPAARPTSAERFVEPQRDLFPPFSRFYFVLAGRVARWDQEAVVAALSAAPDANSGTTAQGRYEWLPEPLVTRDLDTFQIRFWLDAQAVLTQEPPWSEIATERLLADLSAAFATTRTAPVFIVHPAGMETFVPLYERLQAAGLRFRWFAQRPDEPLLLGRHPAQFTDHAIYW